MFDDINTNPDGLVTYEISASGPVVFLDLLLLKDVAWSLSGILSTACY